jgi:hypothetical protein
MGARSIADLVRMVDGLGHVPREGAIRSKDIGGTNYYGTARRYSNAHTSDGSSTQGPRGQSRSPALLSRGQDIPPVRAGCEQRH